MHHRNLVSTIKAFTLVSLLAASGLGASLIAQEQAPMLAMPGAFNVSPSGAASYNIPINVPPGTAGVVPELSLAYSSQSGNGLLGLGWTLQGLPTIERCPRTQAQDGAPGSINFTADDRFCMGGERLVAISGTYGANNTEYRTEIEEFTKIVSYGTSGAGIQWFKVWTKSGQILEFGNTANSRLTAPPFAFVRRWHVNRIGDHAGNYMEFVYNNDTAKGLVTPDRINYTLNSGLPAYNSVRFVYEGRDDHAPLYQSGALTQVDVRLKNIQTYNGEQMVRDYRLNYVAGTNVRPSRITSVALCDQPGNCLPATTFTWSGENNPVGAVGTVWPNPSPPTMGGNHTGDFNGDGLPDFAWAGMPAVSSSDAPLGYVMSTSPNNWNMNVSNLLGFSQIVPNSFGGQALIDLEVNIEFVGDFNGDGYTDAMLNQLGHYGTSGLTLGPMRASVNLNDRTGKLELAHATGGGAPDIAVVFGDLNGDGRDDLLQLRPSPNGAIPYYSNGNGTFSAGAVISGLHSGAVVFAGDFNGNGCTDILAQGTVSRIFYSCNGGLGVDIPNGVALDYKFTLGDFNGDGLTDVLLTHRTAVTELWLSTGTDLVPAWVGPAEWAKYQVNAGDFNGDGRMDIALIALSTTGGNFGPPTTHKIYLSTGAGFAADSELANPAGTNMGIRVQDFNADGLADIWVTRTGTSGSVRHINTGRLQMVTSIDNGLGAAIGVEYKRLNENTSTYLKGTTAIYPVMDVVGLQYVVSTTTTPNGIGGSNSYQYRYEGARYHLQGRAQLGFERTIITDPNNIVHTTTYRQDFPYIGRIASETKVRGSVTLSSLTHTYAADAYTGGVGGFRNRVRLTQTVETANDLNGAALPGRTITFVYDDYNNPTTITELGTGGDTRTTTAVYTNNATNWLLGLQTSTTVVYAQTGLPSITRRSSFQYHATTGLMMQSQIEPTNSALRLTTAYTRDSSGNILTTTLSGADITTATTTYVYDAQRRFVTSTTNALSQTENFTSSAAFGGRLTHQDINGRTTSFQYDGHGRTTRITDSTGRYRSFIYQHCSGVAGGTVPCTTNGGFRVVSQEYRAGGVKSGPEETTIYDRLGRQIAFITERMRGVTSDLAVTETQYDSLGHPYRNTNQYYYLSDGTPRWNTRTYDALGRVVTESYPDSSSSSRTYNGLISTVTNGLSQTTTTQLNAQGRVQSVTEPGPTVTQYAYNAAGDLVRITDPAGNQINHTVDIRGRITQRSDPNIGTWNYQYNVRDQLKQQTDSLSQVTTLSYDILGRLTQQTAPDLTSTFVYDTATNGKGVLDYMQTDMGNRRTYTYDTHGRVSSTTIRIDATDHTFTYSYNTDGRLDTLGYPSGYQVSYQYTGDQRALTYLRETSTSNLIWRADGRHANGQLTAMSLDNVVNVTRQFHPQTALLTNVQAGPSGSPATLANYTYGYDVIGNLTSRSDVNELLTESFLYDNLNRLTQATTGATVYTAAYNSVGNITSKRRLGSPVNNTYAYPTAGATSVRPHAVSSVTGTINGVTNPTFSYDAKGNMINGAGRTMTWQSFNMAATVTEGASTLSYTYDAEHQRIKQSDGTNTIRYLNDPVTGASAEYHTAGGGVWHDYFAVEGIRIGKRTRAISPATITHQRYIQDHLGSVVAVLNSSGSMIQKLSYDAWGLRRYPSGGEDASGSISAPVSRGYTDHEHLPGSRLINMNARMYDPELGRFLSADPYIPNPMRSQAYNRYSYVYNNPLRYTDPSGYNPDCSGCPVIIVTPGEGGFGSGWTLSDWDIHGESHYWSSGSGGGVGGYNGGANLNYSSTYYRGGGIARTEATTIQGNRPLNSSPPRFEMVVTGQRIQSTLEQRLNPFQRFGYQGEDSQESRGWLMDGWNAMLAHLHEHGRVGWIASGQINRVVGVTIDMGSAKLAHEIGSQWTTSGNVKSYSEGRTLVSTSLPGLGTLSAENRKVTGDPAWNYGKPEYQPGLIWSLITGQPITIDVSIGVGYVYENTFTIGRQAGN